MNTKLIFPIIFYHTLDNLTPSDLSDDGSPLKTQVIGLLQATAYLKVPLIVCNLLIIVVEVLLG